MNLDFKVTQENLIVNLIGEFDLHTADYFKEQIEDKLSSNNGKISNLILNLEDIKFIDSSGLGAILAKYKKLNNRGGKVAIVKPTPQVKRIFELSGILKIINIYSSEQEAISNI